MIFWYCISEQSFFFAIIWFKLKINFRLLQMTNIQGMLHFKLKPHNLSIFLGEVIYTTATTKPSAMPTNSLLRSSLSVNSRHHQRTTSGMTSSSSATSSNSNNLNNERHRDNSRNNDLHKTNGPNTFSDSRDDDSPKDGSPINRLQAQNGKNLSKSHLVPWLCKFPSLLLLFKMINLPLQNGIRIDLN